MNVDALAKRSFGILVAGLLGAAAYFQASGVTQLVAARMFFRKPEPTVAIEAVQPSPPRLVAAVANRGDPILSRNPFDSLTGPLDRNPIVVAVPEKPKEVDLSDPLGARECEGITLNIVSESYDDSWSLANLSSPSDPAGRECRIGDTIGELRVAHIGFNSRKAMPAVWLLSDELLCQALLFSKPKTPHEGEGGADVPLAREAESPPRMARPSTPDPAGEGAPDPAGEGGPMQRRGRISTSEELAARLRASRY